MLVEVEGGGLCGSALHNKAILYESGREGAMVDAAQGPGAVSAIVEPRTVSFGLLNFVISQNFARRRFKLRS